VLFYVWARLLNNHSNHLHPLRIFIVSFFLEKKKEYKEKFMLSLSRLIIKKGMRRIIIMEYTALIVIDLQIGVQPENVPLYNLAYVLDGVNQRIRFFRESNNPIIFVQHNDSDLVLNSPK
jgi:hypothetical protein